MTCKTHVTVVLLVNILLCMHVCADDTPEASTPLPAGMHRMENDTEHKETTNTGLNFVLNTTSVIRNASETLNTATSRMSITTETSATSTNISIDTTVPVLPFTSLTSQSKEPTANIARAMSKSKNIAEDFDSLSRRNISRDDWSTHHRLSENFSKDDWSTRHRQSEKLSRSEVDSTQLEGGRVNQTVSLSGFHIRQLQMDTSVTETVQDVVSTRGNTHPSNPGSDNWVTEPVEDLASTGLYASQEVVAHKTEDLPVSGESNSSPASFSSTNNQSYFSVDVMGHVRTQFASNSSHETPTVGPSRESVTALLNTLMLGYDKRLRPAFGGPPLVVKADIEIRSMGPISEKDMIYSMDCYFRQVWTDSRLSFNASTQLVTNVSLSVKMLERIWRPDTIFINGGPSYVHTIPTPNKFFRLSPDGTILYSQRLTIKASCPMNLEKFPMDTQKCPLHIGSFGYPVTDVIYEWHYGNELAAVASNDMRLSQFDLKGMPACNRTKTFKGTQHSVLTVYFDFRRHTGYFLIQVYVPCCLLVVLSWVSFWINREATSDRINLGATTMLTMTFLVLDSRNDLPRVAYSTALDVYVFMCFCFIFASIVQYATVHFFTKYGTADEEVYQLPDSEDEDEEDDDTFEACQSPDVYHDNLKPDSVTACLRKMWRCILSTRSRRFNKNVRNALGLNSVSKIDKVARVLFPAVFCCLNIVYWMSYCW